ncbi:MAG: peroxide stress protein YaaA [Leptolyngbyaceae bacterium]|nr:peroxide stress protein YaaA [Leptolyngbyaceae bacterium]
MIISPAKTLDFSGDVYQEFTVPGQLEESQILIDQLRELTPDEIGQLMKISDNLSTLNWERYRDFHTPFTVENARQALLAFKGDVYKGIEVDRYTAEDFDFAQKHLRILSGLYGILRPLDLIQPYRLEMGTKLTNQRGKNLYEFWGDRLSQKLNADFEGYPDSYLVNLASNEYFKAIAPKPLNAQILHITFKENKAGTYKVVGIHAKRARGLMVDFVIKNRIHTIEPLQSFDVEGYRFNESLTTPNEWVFCRD